MNFGRAFTFVSEDPEWLKKVGIAALVMLIPILGVIVVMGWSLEITRRVINKESEILPDWSNFSEYLSKGFQVFVISFVYSLPVSIISGCAQSISPIMSSVGESAGSDAQMMITIASVVMLCLSCVMIAYDIVVLGFLLPAAMGNYAATGQIGAGFRIGEIIGLVRAAPGAYFMGLLGAAVAGIVASLGLIACIIGVVFTAAYAYLVCAHFWGQSYNVAKAAQSGSAM